MKIEAPENENYSATVIRVPSINKLEGMDNVVGVPLLGFQAIVSKDTKVGDIGVVFTPETQLSEEYAKVNNLHRHAELNADPEKAGFFEDNRRVKAMKFVGHRSDAFFMPLESLAFTGVDIGELNEGDTFDKLNGHEICRKHLKRRESVPRVEKNKHKVFRRVDEKFLPEHYDTGNYWKNADAIKGETNIVVTQKLHGTSIRIGNTIVKRQLDIKERFARKLGVVVAETEFAHVYGSRKVIKDANNPLSQHYYGTDIYSEEGKKYDDLIPENFVVYGELVGWTSDGGIIQKNYSYRLPQGTNELYVYRVAVVTNQGMLVDLSWAQVKEFCRDRGLKVVPELWAGKHKYFKVDDWVDKNFFKEGYKQAVPLDDASPCDEGVCVRVDGIAPYILKAKGQAFFAHETKMKDQDAPDLEEESKEEVE